MSQPDLFSSVVRSIKHARLADGILPRHSDRAIGLSIDSNGLVAIRAVDMRAARGGDVGRDGIRARVLVVLIDSCRDDDALGIGFYQTIASDRYREQINRDFSRETALEIYYRIQLTPWFAVTPGYQFIDDPGALKSAHDAHVFVIRLRGSF